MIFASDRRRDYAAKKTGKLTLPLAIIGLYPQFKCIQYLTKRDPKTKQLLKDEYMSGLGLLEPWLESTCQVHYYKSDVFIYHTVILFKQCLRNKNN